MFVVWEKVLSTDWQPPTTSTLARISDPRVTQFWDPERLLSHSLGEKDRKTKVWDWAAIYGAEAVWNSAAPKPLFSGNPVVRRITSISEQLRAALGD